MSSAGRDLAPWKAFQQVSLGGHRTSVQPRFSDGRLQLLPTGASDETSHSTRRRSDRVRRSSRTARSSSLAAPVITGGLVNVTIVDLVSGNQITAQVPVSVAANICDVSVAVLAQDLRDGTADCSTDTQIITLSAQRR
jgi:hypothetical protein